MRVHQAEHDVRLAFHGREVLGTVRHLDEFDDVLHAPAGGGGGGVDHAERRAERARAQELQLRVFPAELFAGDQAKLVREGTLRGLFDGERPVLSLLTGEPEYLAPMGAEAPEGWIVTGYPWEQIDTAEHKAFVEA